MRLLAFCCIAIFGCGARGAGPGARDSSVANANANENENENANENENENDHRKRLAGDALAYRFVDHVGEAEVTGDLAAAWQSIADHPQRALLPYGRLGGAAAYRAVQMAFADSDVDDYATERVPEKPKPVRWFDPVWNRTRAVYTSRSALYLPGGATQRFRLTVPPRARLEAEAGFLLGVPSDVRGADAARLVVTVDGKVAFERALDPRAWRPVAFDLAPFAGREVAIAFAVEGAAGTHGFVADPILWAGGGGAPGPNVLLVVIDTLRADALPHMPRLRAFAEGAARFDQAITAATWTRPSLLAMYGGDLPSAVGQSAEEMIPDDAERRRFYRRAPPLVPRLLAARGWRASAIGNNFFFLAYPAIGLDLGFEEVDDIRHPVLDTPAVTRSAIRYLRANRERAWLLHLHYDAPHWPYTPPRAYTRRVRGADRRDRKWRNYLAEAAYADEHLGHVLDELSRLGLASRTLVIVTGDHGEVFNRAHDHVVEALAQPTLHHHGWSAYDEVARVPLVVGFAGAIAPATVPTQVRLFDLAATMLDYLGVDGSSLPARGRSLRPVIEGRERADRVAVVEGQNVRALREGGFLYLARTDGRLLVDGQPKLAAEELYDLAADPAQHQDLAPRNPDRLAAMRARLAAESPPPDASIYHLQVAPDERPHRVEGTFASRGRVTVRGGAATSLDAHRVRVDLTGPATLDLAVEPPESPIEVSLTVDGAPLARLLAGEFALPIVDGPLAGERLRRLETRRAPIAGDRGGVILWRDPGPGAALPELPSTASAGDEVTAMMERWGYASPKK